MPTINQNPEQIARDKIDQMLLAAGWLVQSKKQINLSAGKGVAIREYQTEAGPADYVLFVDRVPVGIIEAKREEEGRHLLQVSEQAVKYATSKLRYLDNATPDKRTFGFFNENVVSQYTYEESVLDDT